MSFLLGTRGCFIWSYPRNPFIIIMALFFETADEWGRWVAYIEIQFSFNILSGIFYPISSLILIRRFLRREYVVTLLGG